MWRVEQWRLYNVRRVPLNCSSLWGAEIFQVYIYQRGRIQIFVFYLFLISHLNRNKNKESEPARRNIRRDVETPGHRTRSVSTGRRRTGRQSPDILFQSTPLYLPKNENVKTIEICINKREQTKQINRKQVNKKNTKQVSRKKLSCEGIMSGGLSTRGRGEEGGNEGEEEEVLEDVGIQPGRRSRAAGQYQHPR